LERDDIPEETEYESTDSVDESPGTPETFPRLAGTNYVDRARFELIPDESKEIWKEQAADSSADPILIYYRSLSKTHIVGAMNHVLKAANELTRRGIRNRYPWGLSIWSRLLPCGSI
jgi:hypothetical protein